ncbi:hypothetical protein UlMin_040621 [Ulmus minor]
MEISKDQGNDNSSVQSPHEALFLALAYLPTLELLATSQVSRSLRDAVKNDVLPWMNIVIEKPLSNRLSDHKLRQITSMARGRVTTLALINCEKLSDSGLQQVVQENPHINKLHIPGCTGLTPDGVIRAVKTLSNQSRGLKSLSINGIYNIQNHHLQTLHSYLETKFEAQKKPMPLLFHEYKNFPRHRNNNEEQPAIDLEICPRCKEARMVFDCPRETCKMKRERSMRDCRGCHFCIPRCRECGVCVGDDEELEEVLCEDFLCSDCWLRLPKCSLCYKPYCKQHAAQESCFSGSSEFVCHVCHAI